MKAEANVRFLRILNTNIELDAVPLLLNVGQGKENEKDIIFYLLQYGNDYLALQLQRQKMHITYNDCPTNLGNKVANVQL